MASARHLDLQCAQRRSRPHAALRSSVNHWLLSGLAVLSCAQHVAADARMPWATGISAQPNYQVLARFGHELLTQAHHGTKGPASGQADPYTQKWKGNIAICSIMKQEDPRDIEEFIRYHRFVGVDKFYFRENSNDTAVAVTMQPYVDAGLVDFDFITGPKHPTQTNWYNACSKLAAPLYSWVAFIDLDEFMIVLNKQQAVTERDALKQVLRRSFRYTAAVSLQWVLFGSGGHRERPTNGQMGGFQRCTGAMSKQMKCLGNSYWFHHRATFRPMHVHQCSFRFGAVAVLGNAEPLNMWRVKMVPGAESGPFGSSNPGHMSPSEHKPFTQPSDDYQIALFHYVTRAQDDFIRRKIHMRGGIYATQFAAMAAEYEKAQPSQEQINAQYAAFEHEHGFDGEFPICKQGAAMSEALLAAEADGWNFLRAD